MSDNDAIDAVSARLSADTSEHEMLEQALATRQRIYTHAEVMRRADALIAAAETRHARRKAGICGVAFRS